MNFGALSLLNRTSSRTTFNIAGWHSRHSLTWSWVLALTVQMITWPKPYAHFAKGGCGIGFGQLLAVTFLAGNTGWDASISIFWLRLSLQRQREMWFVDLYRRARDEADGLRGVNDIEALARHEFRDGVSPGAAARQMCRSLAERSKLRTMLEEMLAHGNRASFDRYMILERFKEVDADAAHAAEMESFHRINGLATEAAAPGGTLN